MPRPKRYGSPAFVLRRSGRIVVPATGLLLCRKPNIPTRAKRAARVDSGPLKEMGKSAAG